MVTVVRIRQSDCRHSQQDVTYLSTGILLLPVSSRPNGKKKEKINSTEISYEIIPQKHQTCRIELLMPVACLCINTYRGEGGGSCAPHVVREGLATGQQPSMELRQEAISLMKYTPYKKT